MHKCASTNRHFLIVMVYRHTFESACLKQKFHQCLQQSQINAWYNRSQCTYTSLPIFNVSHNFWVKENLFSSFCLGAILAPLLSITSNNPMVTWFSSQSLEIKLTTTNTSCAPFDIHKSKVRVVDKQLAMETCTYVIMVMVFSTKLGKISSIFFPWMGRQSMDIVYMLALATKWIQ